MLVVISPAKKLDFTTDSMNTFERQPAMLGEAEKLVRKARTLKAQDLSSMMSISDDLANLNVARFKAFETPFTSANARPAIDAFKGDVYVGFDVDTLDDAGRLEADRVIRILSGLYGILRPLDLMQAYRLEMGTRFKTRRGEDLYAFWGDRIAKALKEDLGPDQTLINLASNEYFKAVKVSALGKGAQVITPVFKEIRAGEPRVVSFFAKKARGQMARYIVDNKPETVEELKDFSLDDYRYNPGLSKANNLVFTRG